MKNLFLLSYNPLEKMSSSDKVLNSEQKKLENKKKKAEKCMFLNKQAVSEHILLKELLEYPNSDQPYSMYKINYKNEESNKAWFIACHLNILQKILGVRKTLLMYCYGGEIPSVKPVISDTGKFVYPCDYFQVFYWLNLLANKDTWLAAWGNEKILKIYLQW